MANSFNKVILMGNLTADPEIKSTNNGVSYCSFSIAVARKFAKNGEVDFINVMAWRATADFIGKYFKKGSCILICGQLQTRAYTNAQGATVRVTEVVAEEAQFAGGKGEGNGTQGNGNKPFGIPSAYGGNSAGMQEITDVDGGDLPF
jgi:single-strand DNA-binding protein